MDGNRPGAARGGALGNIKVCKSSEASKASTGGSVDRSSGMTASTTSQYLTSGQVARRLRVSPSTVRRYEREGRLSATLTAGGHRRYDPDDVERLARRPDDPALSEGELDQVFTPVPASRRRMQGKLGARHQHVDVPALAADEADAYASTHDLA